MNAIEITPINGELDAIVTAPPSKAHTLRALFLASLAEGKSLLKNPLLAEDQLVAISALKKFGAKIALDEGNVAVEGTGGALLAPKKVFAANSGVSMRLLCSLASLAGKGGEKIVLDGDGRMRQRPIGDLLAAMRSLGATAFSIGRDDCPPVEVTGNSLRGGHASVKAGKSSQFLSSLLISLPYAREDSVVKIVGELPSQPYIEITINCMNAFGVSVEHAKRKFCIKAGQHYARRTYEVEGDYSSAAFFFQAAAITGGRMKVRGLRKDSLQGDKAFLKFIEKMGCTVRQNKTEAEVTGPSELSPLKANLGNQPDIVMPLAVACAFARGKSRLTNISHLRLKESDRLKALQNELNRIGVKARIWNGGNLVIEGNPERIKGAKIRTYNDHRIAMSFAIAGLKVPAMKIENPECVGKSFPAFFKQISGLAGQRSGKHLKQFDTNA